MLVAEGLGDKEEDNVQSAEGRESSDENGGNDRSNATYGNSSDFAPKMQSEMSGMIDSERSTEKRLTDSLSSYLSRDSILRTIQLPEIPTKFGSGRMTIRSFQGAIDVLSPTSARTRIVTNVNPNLQYIPQSLIDFCMKKMCGVLLSRLQGAARKVLKDPIRSLHARRMREDVSFYQHWLLPKFESYCHELGWEMPPVGALAVNEDDLDEEEYLIYHQLATRPSKGDDGSTREENINSFQNYSRTASEHNYDTIGVGVGTGELFNETRSLQPVMESHHRISRSSRSVGGQSFVSSKSIIQKPVTYFKELESKGEEKKMHAIAASRRRAARRLKASSFTDDQKSRLEELRTAKNRAKDRDTERRQSVITRSMSTCVVTDPQSVSRSIATASISSPKNEVRGGIWGIFLCVHPIFTPLQTLPCLILFMFVVLFSMELTPIYAYAISPVSVGDCAATSFKTTAIFYLDIIAAHVWRTVTTILIIAVFSILHYSVVSAVLAIGVDNIYIGEEAVKHSLEMGMKLFTKVGGKYATMISVGLASLATGKALLSLIMFSLAEVAMSFGVKKIPDFVVNAASTVGAVGSFGTLWWDYIPFKQLFESVRGDFASNLEELVGVRMISGFFFVMKRIFVSGFGALDYVSNRAQQQIEKRFPWRNILSSWGIQFLQSMAGDSDGLGAGVVSWRKSAIDTSKLALAYSALFHLALFVAASFLLPEPHKKKPISSKDDEAPTKFSFRVGSTGQTGSLPSPLAPFQGSVGSLADDSSVGNIYGHGSTVKSIEFDYSINGGAYHHKSSPSRSLLDQDNASMNLCVMPKIGFLQGDMVEKDDEVVSKAAASLASGEKFNTRIETTPDRVLVSESTASTKTQISKSSYKKAKHLLKKMIKSPRRQKKMNHHSFNQSTTSSEIR